MLGQEKLPFTQKSLRVFRLPVRSRLLVLLFDRLAQATLISSPLLFLSKQRREVTSLRNCAFFSRHYCAAFILLIFDLILMIIISTTKVLTYPSTSTSCPSPSSKSPNQDSRANFTPRAVVFCPSPVQLFHSLSFQDSIHPVIDPPIHPSSCSAPSPVSSLHIPLSTGEVLKVSLLHQGQILPTAEYLVLILLSSKVAYDYLIV